VSELVKQGESVGVENRKAKFGDDITGLQELLTYGIKGVAAYADHAQILGKEADEIYAFIIGPSLPAFVTPAALDVLVEKFNIMPIGTVEGDMKAMLGA